MISFLTSLFGDPSAKKLKQYQKDLEKIKVVEIRYRDEIKTIEQVQAKTHEFQTRFSGLSVDDEDGVLEIKKQLELIKCEAFALHRRACELIYGQTFDLGNEYKIEWNMIPYDVQLVGALALHDGNISEMRTGE